jgi:hypothetical protein
VALAKADVGLGNVDNTADTAKPVSAAQQAAIDADRARLDSLEGSSASIQAALDAIEVGLELDIHSFTSIDFTGTTNTAAAVNAAVLAASNAGVTQGRTMGTLSAALSTGAAITSLPVTALAAPLLIFSLIAVKSAGSTQFWTVTATAPIGATSISVAPQTPNFAYPIGSTVIDTVQVKLTGFTSRDILLVDTLYHYRNVWLDCGKARFLKAANGGSMLVPPLATSPATWAATASTNGTNQLTILSNRNAFVVGRTITDAAGKIPGGTTIQAVNWRTNVVTLSAAAAAGAASGAVTITGTTWFGHGQRIRLTGGIWDPNGKTCVGGVLAPFYAERFLYEGATVLLGNLGAADWGIKYGGRVGRITGCNVLGGELVTVDGIHCVHGQNLACDNNYVESGDDPFPVGQEPSSFFTLTDPDPISNVVLTNNRCKSTRGFGVSVYVGVLAAGNTGPDPNQAVTGVTYNGLVGTCGAVRNGATRTIDLNFHDIPDHLIRGVTARGIALQCGSATHDGANPYVIQSDSASDVVVDADVDWTNPAGTTLTSALSTGGPITALPVAELPSALVSGAIVTMEDTAGHQQTWTVAADTAAAATSLPVVSQTPIFAWPIGTTVVMKFIRERIRKSYNCQVRVRTPKRGYVPDRRGNMRLDSLWSGESLDRQRVRFFDDFLDAALDAKWQARVGSDAACSVAILANQPDGVLALTPGNGNTNGVAATDAAVIDRFALNYKASAGLAYGNLMMETRVKLTQPGSVVLNFGFVDWNGVIQVPLVSTGSGPGATRPNAVGFVYDTTSPAGVTGLVEWWGVGIKNSVPVGQILGVRPIGGSFATWVTLRVEIDWQGTATFEIDGRVVAVLANAVDPAVPLTPVLGIMDRPLGAARGVAHVKYVAIEQLRD